ncbi:MAG: response regulator [Planctomycetaceae bacterium]|nr:response regulator [Planctomycetaceae bacterium]
MNVDRWTRFVRVSREEILVAIEAVTQTSGLLLEKSDDPSLKVPEQVRRDLETVYDSSRELYQFIREVLESPDQYVNESASGEDSLRSLRHDLRNRLNVIHGPCQFMLMEELPADSAAQREFQKIFLNDVTNIRDYANQAVNRLNELSGIEGELAMVEAADTSSLEALKTRDQLKLNEPVRIREKPVEPARVLVVDDNELNRRMLARFMDHMGHQSDFAADGREALGKIQQTDFDLVLLDILMPHMNGLEVLQELNDQGLLRHLPVLVLSGLDSSAEIIQCIELGAEDFLSRPINLTLLKARVNACLEKKRLREREFGQFFPREIARQVALRPEMLDEGREADVSVLFCDIRAFSKISEKLEPEKVVRWIRDVMEVLSECVLDHQGVLVDYIGDELVAMWGAPTEQPDHAQLASRAALAMVERLPAISRKWSAELGLPTQVGIGVNSGKAHVGNTGTARRRKYGPLGNTVNLASRVQGASRFLQSSLLVTGMTFDQLDADEFSSRRLCTVQVNNIEEPVELYEIVPLETDGWLSLSQRYEQALEAFENQEFRLAASMLGDLLVHHPSDGPSLLLMSRAVNELIKDDDEEPFDPVWHLSGK